MKTRSLFKNPLVWLMAGSVATAIVVACSNSTTPAGSGTGSADDCTNGDTVACTCTDGKTGTGICGQLATTCSCTGGSSSSNSGSSGGSSSGSATRDAGQDSGGPVDAASPVAIYKSCAANGGFGWPCTIGTSGTGTPDPTECTDPNFPDCYLYGDAGWCTTSCAGDASGLAACLSAADAAAADIAAIDGDGGDAGGPGCTPAACAALGYCQ